MPSSDLEIAAILAWEAFDSRGEPTVACRVTLAGGATGRAIVPAGASTGRHEAREWRDDQPRMAGRGVRGAVALIRGTIQAALLGVTAGEPSVVDAVLRRLASSDTGTFLGSNTSLAVSVAAARAGAAGQSLPLWRLLAGTDQPAFLPLPMIQILAGGVHAGGVIDLQDVMAIPIAATTFGQSLEMVWCVRAAAVELARPGGHNLRLVGDEGGLAIPFPTNRAAVDFVARAIERAGLAGEVQIGIDVAASQLVAAGGRYRLAMEDRTLERDAWIDELAGWVRDLPICSIEDPIDEDDWEGWAQARESLDIGQLVGDDLFATDPGRLARGIRAGAANAILVKPNQRGTLTEAVEVVLAAQASGWRTIVSARSGESEDNWLADLAVGWRAGQIKVGSLSRSERTAKWNRLLELEATLDRTQLADPFDRRPIA